MRPWYPVSPTSPPFRARVNVSWAGREFTATRVHHPKKKRIVWVTLRADGELEYLPPKGRNKIWGDDPDLWQPMDLNKWEHPLPEPLRSSAPNWPLPLATASIQEGARDPLWWRDATLVGYHPPGEISRREAEGRVMRALNTNQRIRVERPTSKSCADVIAQMSEARATWEDTEDIPSADWRPPFEPLGHDFDDFLLAMSWYNALNPPEMWHKNRRFGSRNRAQLVLVYRAMDPPASWGFIGTRWGVSVERVRQVYASALDKLERAANGRPVYKHIRVADPMIKVREGNKRHAAEKST